MAIVAAKNGWMYFMPGYSNFNEMAIDAVGLTVQRKGTEKCYLVERARGVRVFLRAQTKGARSGWKLAADLWLDFDLFESKCSVGCDGIPEICQ